MSHNTSAVPPPLPTRQNTLRLLNPDTTRIDLTAPADSDTIRAIERVDPEAHSGDLAHLLDRLADIVAASQLLVSNAQAQVIASTQPESRVKALAKEASIALTLAQRNGEWGKEHTEYFCVEGPNRQYVAHRVFAVDGELFVLTGTIPKSRLESHWMGAMTIKIKQALGQNAFQTTIAA